jgi:hypothetical protein
MKKEKGDQQRHRNADRKSQHIDCGIESLPDKIPHGDPDKKRNHCVMFSMVMCFKFQTSNILQTPDLARHRSFRASAFAPMHMLSMLRRAGRIQNNFNFQTSTALKSAITCAICGTVLEHQ